MITKFRYERLACWFFHLNKNNRNTSESKIVAFYLNKKLEWKLCCIQQNWNKYRKVEEHYAKIPKCIQCVSESEFGWLSALLWQIVVVLVTVAKILFYDGVSTWNQEAYADIYTMPFTARLNGTTRICATRQPKTLLQCSQSQCGWICWMAFFILHTLFQISIPFSDRRILHLL